MIKWSSRIQLTLGMLSAVVFIMEQNTIIFPNTLTTPVRHLNSKRPQEALRKPTNAATNFKETYDRLNLEMLWIPSRNFQMGSSSGATGEVPLHSIELDGFWIGKTEVTVGQFRIFIEATGYVTDAEKKGNAAVATSDSSGGLAKEGANWRNPNFQQSQEHPVVCVSWNDAMAFCLWLSSKTKNNYTLPTEAQWEYAARGGVTTAYPWGDNPDAGTGWTNVADKSAKEIFSNRAGFSWDDGYVYTSPVGSFKPNAFGLYDVIGNAMEWCKDYYSPDYYPTSPIRNPENTIASTRRVIRGGSWLGSPRSCRLSFSGGFKPDDPSDRSGFRIVRVPE